MENSIVLGSMIASVAVLASVYLLTRYKERKAMIEKGLDPSLVNIYSKNNYHSLFLYAGILLLGIAMGILTGISLAKFLQTPGETKELIIISLIVWLGISCIICYYLSRNRGNA
jgi:hypothetical protein